MIDRDKILVPANWDSWGKIRIIREGFDMEGVSTAWSIEIQDPPEPLDQPPVVPQETDNEEDGTSAVTVFEQTIQDPKRDPTKAAPGTTSNGTKIEVETSDLQGFLTQQLETLEQLKAKDEKDRANEPVPSLEMSPMDDEGRVNEHIGPVQFNMGGIQVDADDMLKKLKVSLSIYNTKYIPSGLLMHEQDREASRAQRKESASNPVDEKAHNKALANFFAGLVKKPNSSPRGSPSS